MPTYNAIQTDRIEAYLKKLASIRNGGIAPTLAPEVGVELAVPQLDDMLGLAGYIPWGWYQAQPAVAGEYSYGGVANGTGRSLFTVQLTASSSVTTRLMWVVFDSIGIGFDNLCPADQANWRDTRRQHASFPLSVAGISLGTGTVAVAPPGLGGGGLAIGGVHALASTGASSPIAVLRPGTALFVASTVVNVDLTISATGFIREALPDELVI